MAKDEKAQGQAHDNEAQPKVTGVTRFVVFDALRHLDIAQVCTVGAIISWPKAAGGALMGSAVVESITGRSDGATIIRLRATDPKWNGRPMDLVIMASGAILPLVYAVPAKLADSLTIDANGLVMPKALLEPADDGTVLPDASKGREAELIQTLLGDAEPLVERGGQLPPAAAATLRAALDNPAVPGTKDKQGNWNDRKGRIVRTLEHSEHNAARIRKETELAEKAKQAEEAATAPAAAAK